MRNTTIRLKLIKALGTFLVLIFLIGGIFTYSFQRIQSKFLDYQTAQKFSSHVRESKNWAVRYTIEEDPQKLATWKKNYAESFQKAFSLVHSADTLKTTEENLTLYNNSVKIIFEKHEERLALLEHKKGLIEEYQSKIEEIPDSHSLKKEFSKNQSLYTKPLVTSLEVMTETELHDLLEKRKETFIQNADAMDKKLLALLQSASSVPEKQFLHKIKVANLSLRHLVLGQDQLHDTLHKEIQHLLFIWTSIENLNTTYQTVDNQTQSLALLVSQYLESTKKHSYEAYILLFILSLAVSAGMIFYVSTNILKPLENLTIQVKNIDEGHLNVQIPVPPSKDEIFDLATAFNFMTDHLYRSREQLKLATQEVLKLYKSKKNSPISEPKTFEPDYPTLVSLEFKNALAIIKQAFTNLEIPQLTKEQKEKTYGMCNRAIDRLLDLCNMYFDLPKEKESDKKVA